MKHLLKLFYLATAFICKTEAQRNNYYSENRGLDKGGVDEIHKYAAEHRRGHHRFKVSACKPLQESHLPELFAHIDASGDAYVKELAQSIRIPSVSAYLKDYPQLLKITTWAQTKLEEMGFETRIQFVQRKRAQPNNGNNERDDNYDNNGGGENKGKGRRRSKQQRSSASSSYREENNRGDEERILINHSSHVNEEEARRENEDNGGGGRQKRHGILEFYPPPFLFAEYPGKNDNNHHPINVTLLIYAHLDVVPAQRSDGWTSDPFILTRRGNLLFGRGVSDNKGPLVAWLSAVRAFIDLNICMPIRLKFFIEAMEESGSVGMQRVLHQEKSFFQDVNYAVVSDNFCPNSQRPCLTYGLRGLLYFMVEIKSASEDLHSGIYGGSVSEAMQELVTLLSQLTDRNGTILVPGLYHDIPPFSQYEILNYANFSFDLEDYKHSVGSLRLLHSKSKIDMLAHKWRLPSLSIHGIEGAFSGPGAKTVIPHKVTGKFSIRLVPNQSLRKVKKRVISYLTDLHEKARTGNEFKIHLSEEIEAWITDPDNLNFKLATRALRKVYGSDPDLCRDGGTVPVALYLSKLLNNPDSLILIPLATAENGAHSEREHIDLQQFLQGVKSLVSYIYEISAHHREQFPSDV